MKYTGRFFILLFSISISVIETFFEEITMLSIAEAFFFATCAFLVGWTLDKSNFYRKQAELSEKHNRDLIESSPEPILVYQNDEIVFVNDKLLKLVQRNAQDIIGKSIFDFLLPDYHPLVKRRMKELNNRKQTVDRIELKIAVGSNRVMDIEVSSAYITYNNKPSIEVFLRDVTGRKILEDKLRRNEELYRFITENSTDIISYLKPNGMYEYISPSCNQFLGYKQEEIIGTGIIRYLHPEESKRILQLIINAESSLDFVSFSHRLRKKDHSYIWLETNVRAIRHSNKRLEGIVSVSRDISERIQKEKELEKTNEMLLYLSKMDGLTSIPNRRFFEEKLQEEWFRTMRHSTSLSAMMIDIDYFKKYNDHYGHQAGDTCIKLIANVLKSTLKRPGDFVARYGGEEFVVLLPETGHQGTAYLGELFLTNIRDLELINDVSEIGNYITVSIGCATLIPTDQHKPEELIKLADQALYVAKKKGRNQVVSSNH
ncbi:sensor domain-containing diguanylate cyclase [Bacillus sp. Marseille-P3661]|uniref:sensor domain-containing diguanylate cyclase n=1 Tax=Bacillus sp. Marseille-P3661 TaxID=1936234 RepID=UPI000C843BC3|nr:diguanylate cyclase [Bacillus sp. Marseille-P3661]